MSKFFWRADSAANLLWPLDNCANSSRLFSFYTTWPLASKFIANRFKFWKQTKPKPTASYLASFFQVWPLLRLNNQVNASDEGLKHKPNMRFFTYRMCLVQKLAPFWAERASREKANHKAQHKAQLFSVYSTISEISFCRCEVFCSAILKYVSAALLMQM